MSEELLWPPNEMADLMDALARSADRQTNSYSETAHLARNAALTIRSLHEQLVCARNDALEEAAQIARNGCLVPPDGGSPTEEEAEICESIASQIRLRKLKGAEAVFAPFIDEMRK